MCKSSKRPSWWLHAWALTREPRGHDLTPSCRLRPSGGVCRRQPSDVSSLIDISSSLLPFLSLSNQFLKAQRKPTPGIWACHPMSFYSKGNKVRRVADKHWTSVHVLQAGLSQGKWDGSPQPTFLLLLTLLQMSSISPHFATFTQPPPPLSLGPHHTSACVHDYVFMSFS